MVFDGVSKSKKDLVVEQMVDKATKVLEAVADELWVPWAKHLVPNVSCRFRAEAEAKARDEQDRKLREEVEHIIEEKLARAVKWDKQLEEKLMEVLEGWLTQVAIENDSEAEEMREAEESEAVGTMGGTQLLAMEVDEKEEDEVMVVEEVKWGKMRKWAPSLPPKMLRKRVQVGTVGSQVGSRQAGSMGRPCNRCIKHQTQCVVISGVARCENCQVKHYGCLLMPAKEVVGGKGGLSGSQKAKAVEGSQMKGQAKKARRQIMLGKSILIRASLLSLMWILELGKSKIVKHVQAASAVGTLCTSQEALHCSINALCSHLETYDMEVWSIVCEQDMCVALMKELEEALTVEELMDKVAEMVQEKVHYDAKMGQVVWQEVIVKEDHDEGEGEDGSKSEEEEDELVCHFGLLAKAQGKHPAK